MLWQKRHDPRLGTGRKCALRHRRRRADLRQETLSCAAAPRRLHAGGPNPLRSMAARGGRETSARLVRWRSLGTTHRRLGERHGERYSVVEGKSVSLRVDHGDRRNIKKKSKAIQHKEYRKN